MVSKKIRIEFADTSYRAVDYLQDIREATENAGLNLFSRHNVRLQYPMPHDGIVMVEIQIPDDIAESFPIGHHLRCI